MGLPTQRSLNGDLDNGLDDGRSRQSKPNWGGHTPADYDALDHNWRALHGCEPVQGRHGSRY
ncbi:hypothetical protein AB0A69_07515 [Streptomyces sp. NPDC045431]|uniref:hypothetical protein n=1 Tax=Streptomyces sp. NPDC045431 TaxID=3155613 RepID=UPI0033F50CBC